jgi:hypothetical protein
MNADSLEGQDKAQQCEVLARVELVFKVSYLFPFDHIVAFGTILCHFL